jgi:hypothetical protein
MEEQLERRLLDLRAEFDAGQKVSAELDAKQASIRNTLLRISGAIQVLEEVLGAERLRRDRVEATGGSSTAPAGSP